MTHEDGRSHKLVLLPRDHQKSAIAAYYVAWEITRNPTIRILYISATANLAQKQLRFIKDILTSDIYRFYWPEMVNERENDREKWSESEICVDHPLRKAESVRDSTVFTAGLTTVITGLHCDLAVCDDVVVDDNAYNDEGRRKVRDQISYLSSILGTDGKLLAVGTRYHPKDLYHDMQTTLIELYSPSGEIESSDQLYDIFERKVEDRGDGGGQFLWPRTQRSDGKWFGFNREILAKKKAQYVDMVKFRAQYYNDPNDADSSSVKRTHFQYYDKKHLRKIGGKWHYKNSRLNVFAAVDFAYSTSQQADYTCVVVVGVDSYGNYYVLDIDRFKTNKVSDYFDSILKTFNKWDYRKLRAEVTAAQMVIVKDLKDNYIRRHGLALSVEDYRPTGDKEERIEATLQPRYNNLQMWHYVGGNCDLLEEELLAQRPPHDDIKDALASAVDMAIPPANMTVKPKQNLMQRMEAHHRFGGIN